MNGPVKLSGEVKISKAKNAYLPLLAATILAEKDVLFKEVPNLRDIRTMNRLLAHLGVQINEEGGSMRYSLAELKSDEAPYELVKTMRASICVLGPMLARFKKGKVSLPGGCAIGSRPIDLHLKNLEKLGAKIELKNGYVEASTDGLKGTHLTLDFPSVGATENLMMAATLAEGETVIENAALEPEITDLGNFLNSIGAKITGLDTKKIVIQGVKSLTGGEYTAIGDRIEAATYIMAGLMTGSQLKVTGFNPGHIDAVLDKLEAMGATLERFENGVEVFPSELKAVNIDTAPYPGFPTDVQAQMMALATQVEGSSIITEHIFENRFMHVPEMRRLGAEITVKGNSAIVKGGLPLKGAPVMCTDLRASAALVMSALCCEGESEVRRVYHLDRGYDNLDTKLKNIGANLQRVNEEM